jgi:MFS family permease
MVLQPKDVEYVVTIAALPASLAVLVAGYLGSRYEHKPLMYAFMLSCVGACAYFTYKVRTPERHAFLSYITVVKAVPDCGTTRLVKRCPSV